MTDPAAPDEALSHAIGQAVGQAIIGGGADQLPALAPTAPDDQLHLVRRAAAAESVSRELLHQSVRAARAAGLSWAAIGAELGLSRQGVQQRFGSRTEPEPSPQYRWLGPVTAFEEMAELEIAGRLGWHTAEAGMLRHRMVRADTQWEHRRAVWSGAGRRYEQEGWQVGARAFPWVYLVRDLGAPAEQPAEQPVERPAG